MHSLVQVVASLNLVVFAALGVIVVRALSDELSEDPDRPEGAEGARRPQRRTVAAHAHRGDLIYHDADPHGARFELVLPAANG